MTTRRAIPDTPVSHTFHQDAYTALAKILSAPEIVGVGAGVRDQEILRLVCLEKLRRDGQKATSRSGLVANFLANLSAPWAEDLVQFWDEGLGWGWNLWINGENPLAVKAAIDAGARPDLIFLPFPLPARLLDYHCELHDHWAWCRYAPSASKLSSAEQATWDEYKQNFNIKVFLASLGDEQ